MSISYSPPTPPKELPDDIVKTLDKFSPGLL